MRPPEISGLPRGAVCAGLYSSASTWLYNVVASLFSLFVPADTLMQIYADEIDWTTADALLQGRPFVLKSHRPDAALRAYIHMTGVPVFLSIRDPRDATASLMQRFGVSFRDALSDIAASAEAVCLLHRYNHMQVFRFEDHFANGHGTIERLASRLNVQLNEGDLRSVENTFSRAAVLHQLQQWQDLGVFRHGPPAQTFEPTTHWHPNHVGDGEIGKWRNVLQSTEVAMITAATREFCDMFEYPYQPEVPQRATLSFSPTGIGQAYLEHGFGKPECWGVWATDESGVRIPLKRTPRSHLKIQFECNFLQSERPLNGLRVALNGRHMQYVPVSVDPTDDLVFDIRVQVKPNEILNVLRVEFSIDRPIVESGATTLKLDRQNTFGLKRAHVYYD